MDVIDVGSHDVFTAYNANRVTSSAHGTSDAFTFKFSSPRMDSLLLSVLV